MNRVRGRLITQIECQNPSSPFLRIINNKNIKIELHSVSIPPRRRYLWNWNEMGKIFMSHSTPAEKPDPFRVLDSQIEDDT